MPPSLARSLKLSPSPTSLPTLPIHIRHPSTFNDEEHKIAQFADNTQMMSEGDAISFEQSISTVDNFGRKSGLVMNSGKTQAIWLGSKRQSLTKYRPHIKIDWNPPKFKILGVWLTADLTDCEEINYNNNFFLK